MPFICAYVLLTHGRNSLSSLAAHPAARQQLANIRHAFRETDVKIHWFCDYARSHSTLNDLPQLRDLLDRSAELDAGTIVMDDLGRLFRNVPADERPAFLKELQAFGGRIFGLRQQCQLRDVSRDMTLILLTGGAPGTFVVARPERRQRSSDDLREQTANANVVSGMARKKRADAFACEIAVLRDELAVGQGAPKLKAIAEAGNERGMRSPRGKPLTEAIVSRALKRAESITAEREKGSLAERAKRMRETLAQN